jgi:hypothetical protein
VGVGDGDLGELFALAASRLMDIENALLGSLELVGEWSGCSKLHVVDLEDGILECSRLQKCYLSAVRTKHIL